MPEKHSTTARAIAARYGADMAAIYRAGQRRREAMAALSVKPVTARPAETERDRRELADIEDGVRGALTPPERLERVSGGLLALLIAALLLLMGGCVAAYAQSLIAWSVFALMGGALIVALYGVAILTCSPDPWEEERNGRL